MFYRTPRQFWVWEDRVLLSLLEFDNLRKTVTLNGCSKTIWTSISSSVKMRSFNFPNYQDLWDASTGLDAKEGHTDAKSQIESPENSPSIDSMMLTVPFTSSMLILIPSPLLHDYTALKYWLKNQQIKFGFINLSLWISDRYKDDCFLHLKL